MGPLKDTHVGRSGDFYVCREEDCIFREKRHLFKVDNEAAGIGQWTGDAWEERGRQVGRKRVDGLEEAAEGYSDGTSGKSAGVRALLFVYFWEEINSRHPGLFWEQAVGFAGRDVAVVFQLGGNVRLEGGESRIRLSTVFIYCNGPVRPLLFY